MKTNLDDLFKTSKTNEIEGVDFVIRPENKEEKISELSFRVRRFVATNPRVKAAMAAYYKPYARQVELGTLSPEKQVEISINLFIDVCLVSWKGVEVDGKPVECTKENAMKLFTALPELFDTLWTHCNNFQNYKEDLGNS